MIKRLPDWQEESHEQGRVETHSGGQWQAHRAHLIHNGYRKSDAEWQQGRVVPDSPDMQRVKALRVAVQRVDEGRKEMVCFCLCRCAS